MADDVNALAALLSGGFNRGTNAADDILGFQKTIAANDVLRQIAPAVVGARFDTSTWSPGTTFGVTAGQAFLGSVLNAIGQAREGAQLEKVAQVLPQLYSDPTKVNVPEGVDPEAFGGLKLQAMARGNSDDQKRFQAIQELFLKPRIAGMEAAAQTSAKLNAEKEFYGSSGAANPDNPIEKKVVELRNDFDKRDEVQNFKYVSRLSNQLVETLKNPSAVADPVLAKMVIQFVEPKMAVNAGEAAGLAASTSIPEGWKATIAKAMTGETSLPPDVRKGLLDIASAAYSAHSNAYKKTFDLYSAEANRFNIPMDRISSFGSPVAFSSIAQTVNDPSGSVDLSVLKAEAAKLKATNPGLSQAEIAATLRARFGGAPNG